MDKGKMFRWEKNGQSVKLTAHIYMMQNFGMGGSRSLLPCVCLWHCSYALSRKILHLVLSGGKGKGTFLYTP
jgi:hypothetical protein